MISAAFIVPHSPILINNIGKKSKAILKKTSQSFDKIKDHIKNNHVDNIIIISSNVHNTKSNISLNAHFQYRLNFEQFGDYFSKLNLNGAVSLSYILKEAVQYDINADIFTQSKISYSTAIPLYLTLSENNQKIQNFRGRILEINTSCDKDLKEHFLFGKKISKTLEQSEENNIIICSGELSHSLSKRSPAGFFPKSESFDNKVIENLKKEQEGVKELINTKEKTMIEVKESALRQIVLMLGVIHHRKYQTKTLSYQKDLGLGYLCMDMGL